MVPYDRLRLALAFLTDGPEAALPERLKLKRYAGSDFRKAIRKLRREARPWTQGAGVQGIGIGEKVADGEMQGALVIRVYVSKKKADSNVKNLVPKFVDVPDVGRVETDVIEIGRLAGASFGARVRPAMPGSGLCHVNARVGTFGCLVRRNGSSTKNYILSNSHVLALSGLAQKGDEVIQPGFVDGGITPHDVIGRLRAWQPFDFGDGYPNLVDAAIAEVAPTKAKAQIRLLGAAPDGMSHAIRRGMRVQKVGRTTDLTTGEVTDADFRLRVRYPKPGGGNGLVGLRDQVLCTRFGDKGDSGAAVLNASGKLVGLYFADSPSISVFNRIEHVFSELDIRLA